MGKIPTVLKITMHINQAKWPFLAALHKANPFQIPSHMTRIGITQAKASSQSGSKDIQTPFKEKLWCYYIITPIVCKSICTYYLTSLQIAKFIIRWIKEIISNKSPFLLFQSGLFPQNDFAAMNN